MSDASLVSFLQSELLLLSNEIKKKYPEIKESVENIFQLIRKIKDDPERPNAVEVFAQTELILQPIVLACRTGNVKVVAIAINCLQKLVMFQAFPRECLGTVFSVLEATVELSGEVQLKALQCLSPLMANYSDIYHAELFKLFSIAFKLHESKAPMVNNAAAAIIRQMIITLFERVSDEQESSGSEKQHTSDALNILSEICAKLSSSTPPETPACLDLSKIDRPFALDLIESIMSNHGSVFRAEPAFVQVIKERLCPLIVECFQEGDKKGDFARTCRLWRLARLIVCDFSDLLSECVQNFFSLWSLILKDVKSSAWEKAAVMEILKTILCSSLLLESVFSVCQEQPFNEVLDAMLQLMSAILAAFPNEGLIVDQKNAVLNQVDKSTPPPVSQNYLLLLGFEAFTSWTSNLIGTVRGVTAKPLGHFLAPISQFEAARDRDMQMAAQLLKLVGPRLATILVHLRAQSGEPLIQLITLFAIFEQKTDLDLLFKTLFPFILPEPLAADPFVHASSVQGGNGQLLQMILESAKDLAELLQDCWIWIARLQLGLSHLYWLKNRKGPIVALPFDLAASNAAEDALIERSASFSESAWTFLIQGHCTLLGEGLSRDATGSLLSLLDRVEMILSLSFKQRIVDAEETCVAWECLTGTLIAAGRSKESIVRLGATKVLAKCALEELIKQTPPANFKANKQLQVRVLKPIALLVHSAEWPDLIRSVLDALLGLIGVLGEGLGEDGWSSVFQVCQDALNAAQKLGDPNSNPWDDSDLLIKESGGPSAASSKLYRQVHDLIKSAVTDHLSCLSLNTIDQLAELISALGRIKLSAEEVNIPLNAVRYLWDISDHLAGLKSLPEAQVFASWLRVLKQLAALGLDERPELRNSAVQTMLRTANMNGAALKAHWTAVLEDLLFPFLRSLKEASATVSNSAEAQSSPVAGFAHFSRDSAAKQWYETESSSLTGFTQLLQTHQQTLLQLSEWPRYWREALSFFESYVLKSGAEELVSVAVGSMLLLSNSFSAVEACRGELFAAWKRVTQEMTQSLEIPFCQDSLLKLAKVPLQVTCPAQAASTLEGLSTILQYATPADSVRDSEAPSELQRFYCTALLDELPKICSSSLLVEEISKWIVLARGANDSGLAASFSFGYPSLRSRQSTASSTKSSTQTPAVPVSSPLTTEYSFIGMVSCLIPRSVALIDEACSEAAIEVLLRAYGKYMKAKFKCPGRLDSPLWLSATEAFQSTVRSLPPQQKLLSLWPIILEEMRNALLASKNMFASGSSASDWAEEVDCAWFKFMRVEIVPNLEAVLIDELVALLIEVARITRFSADLPPNEPASDFKFPSGVGPMPVAVKEKFCFAAWELVVELALNGSHQALLKLAELTRLHLTAFIKDRRVLGAKFPLSRLRMLELSVLLGGCLRIPGCDHLQEMAALVVEVEGHPQSIVSYCRRILKRLNGIPEDEPSADPSEPLKRHRCPSLTPPSRPHSLIVLPAESRPLSPASKRSFSDAIIQNFRSMELFDSGE